METNNEKPDHAPERVIDSIDSKERYAVEIESAQGMPLVFSGTKKSVTARLRDAAFKGEIKGDLKAIVHQKTSQGKWFSREVSVCHLPHLAPIYRPFQSLLGKMIGIGALIGISWETLYQSYRLFQHYQSIAPVILFWLPVAFLIGLAIDDATGGSIFRFVFPGIIILIFMGKGGAMMQSINKMSEVLAPTFGALVVSGAIGATLGITALGGLSCVWILLRGQHIPTAPDAKPESISRYKVLAVLFFVTFAALFVTYAKWTRSWPVAVEIYLREDLKKHPIRG